MNKNLYRKELDNYAPYVQGKPIEAVRREYGLDRIEKLASNENQFGPSPKAVAAMREELENVNFYPESHPFELVAALAAHLGVEPARISVGVGGEGILWQIAMSFLNAGDEIVVPDPTFDVYRISATMFGATTVKIPLAGRRFDIDATLAAVNARTKLVVLTTPNNPTGHIASREELDRLLAGLPEDVILVLDEAYYEFARARADYPDDSVARTARHPNLIVLRTFSKIYGLAGLRIGYCVASAEITEKLNAVRLTFGVNRLAHAAAKAALEDGEYMRRVVSENGRALDALTRYFDGRGMDYFPSYTNFLWVDTKRDSKCLFEELQKRGVIVRAGWHWGWDTWLRVSTGRAEQTDFFFEQMDAALGVVKP